MLDMCTLPIRQGAAAQDYYNRHSRELLPVIIKWQEEEPFITDINIIATRCAFIVCYYYHPQHRRRDGALLQQ